MKTLALMVGLMMGGGGAGCRAHAGADSAAGWPSPRGGGGGGGHAGWGHAGARGGGGGPLEGLVVLGNCGERCGEPKAPRGGRSPDAGSFRRRAMTLRSRRVRSSRPACRGSQRVRRRRGLLSGNVQVLAGDDADLSVEGDVGVSASGAAGSGHRRCPAQLPALPAPRGPGLHVGARGDAAFAAESLVTAFRGDAEVTGARLGLTTTDRVSVVAGDVAMQTPGAARVHTEGASAQLDEDAKLASSSNMVVHGGEERAAICGVSADGRVFICGRGGWLFSECA